MPRVHVMAAVVAAVVPAAIVEEEIDCYDEESGNDAEGCGSHAQHECTVKRGVTNTSQLIFTSRKTEKQKATVVRIR